MFIRPYPLLAEVFDVRNAVSIRIRQRLELDFDFVGLNIFDSAKLQYFLSICFSHFPLPQHTGL